MFETELHYSRRTYGFESCPDRKKQMERPVLIFSHNYLVKDWRTIVGEQMGLLKRTGLYDKAAEIHFGVHSEDFDSIAEFGRMVRNLDLKSKSTIHVHPENDAEKRTLIILQETCRRVPEADVLYYHTKGVTADPFLDPEKYRTSTSWRRAMEYFSLEKWPLCINALKSHDCVGILYGEWDNGVWKMTFFSGNFWWSKSEHMNNTPSMHGRDNWMGCETLVTSIPHAWSSLYHPTIMPQDFYFDPEDYRKL
jgi:hypothetical protein